MDCIYKSNKYQLLLMEIVGVTSTELTFSVAFVYLKAEHWIDFYVAFAYLEVKWEDNFSWCLDSLNALMHGRLMPYVIVTDKGLALVNAVKKIFHVSRYFLFSRHIRKIILAQCKKTFETKEKVDLFMSEWNIMVMADT